MQVIQSLDLEDSVVVEFQLNEVWAEVEADDFLYQVVAQVQGAEVGGVDGVRFDKAQAVGDEVGLLTG